MNVIVQVMKDNFYKGLADKNKPKDPAIANLEDNSYDDIDWLNKANAPIHKEIEEWKRKYKDMHNLATQAMSKVHQLEKEAQEK